MGQGRQRPGNPRATSGLWRLHEVGSCDLARAEQVEPTPSHQRRRASQLFGSAQVKGASRRPGATDVTERLHRSAPPDPFVRLTALLWSLRSISKRHRRLCPHRPARHRDHGSGADRSDRRLGHVLGAGGQRIGHHLAGPEHVLALAHPLVGAQQGALDGCRRRRDGGRVGTGQQSGSARSTGSSALQLGAVTAQVAKIALQES